MNPQFTESVTKALTTAIETAKARSHTEVTEHHVLLAFFEGPSEYF